MTIQAAHPATPEPPDHHDCQEANSPVPHCRALLWAVALRRSKCCRWDRPREDLGHVGQGQHFGKARDGGEHWRTVGGKPGGLIRDLRSTFVFCDFCGCPSQTDGFKLIEKNMIYGLVKLVLKGSLFEAEPSELHPLYG